MKQIALPLALAASLCTVDAAPGPAKVTFGDELQFLSKHTPVVVLHDNNQQAKVIVAPDWQGRVMTSTASGDAGDSFGWVNRDLIASKKIQPHINVFGGEDRFWLGPEGGQFSIFFPHDAPFDLEHWQTPPSLDTEPFKVIAKSAEHVVCQKNIHLVNYSGTLFDLEVRREVRLQKVSEALHGMALSLPTRVTTVAFESVNTVKNSGKQPWAKKTGLLSIWILGMFNASPASTIVVPFEPGPDSERGPKVNDTYFGKVPTDRLLVQDGVLFFRADAQYRSKIGLSAQRAKPILGSYDASTHTLTLVRLSFDKNATDYVNSMWELQKQPYRGDVVNSYNDDGKLGKFYELESSSAALSLKPGASATHRQQTMHFQGDEKELDTIAQAALGVGLDAIRGAFKP